MREEKPVSLVQVCSFCFRFLEVTDLLGATDEQARMMTEHISKIHHLHPYYATR